jgi:hypothetical protein
MSIKYKYKWYIHKKINEQVKLLNGYKNRRINITNKMFITRHNHELVLSPQILLNVFAYDALND